jgi:hypothetical protein
MSEFAVCNGCETAHERRKLSLKVAALAPMLRVLRQRNPGDAFDYFP